MILPNFVGKVNGLTYSRRCVTTTARITAAAITRHTRNARKMPRADKLRHAKVARSQKRNRILPHARKLSTVTKLTLAINIFSQVS
jgi:hypothetical protein